MSQSFVVQLPAPAASDPKALLKVALLLGLLPLEQHSRNELVRGLSHLAAGECHTCDTRGISGKKLAKVLVFMLWPESQGSLVLLPTDRSPTLTRR